MSKSLATWILLLTVAVAGPAPTPAQDAPAANPAAGDLAAVAWMQASIERRASCIQTFAMARMRLPELLADTTRSACVEQGSLVPLGKPPAIVVDVDETVLDNMAYNARLHQDAARFDDDTWNAWVMEARAKPVPGARLLLVEAAQRGVRVFYVTNRGSKNPETQAAIELATRKNLESLGYPVVDPPGGDCLMLKYEHDDAGSEKSPRRRAIADQHRIIMIVGDDLGDFLPEVKGSRGATEQDTRDVNARRADWLTETTDWWADRWFILPNPVYGSWRGLAESNPQGLEAALDAQR